MKNNHTVSVSHNQFKGGKTVKRHTDSSHSRQYARRSRAGFTLVELVVVVLILGIIAAVAAPRMFDVASDARLHTTMESLNVVRDAIELYHARNGSFPGTDEATFKTELDAHLRGPFPQCHVGNQNDSVRVVTADSLPLSASGTEGWAYNANTGEFIINHADYSDL